MLERLEQALARFLRIDPVPVLPAGTSGSARVFRASLNFYRYRLGVWALKQAVAAAGVVLVFVLTAPPVARFAAGAPLELLPVPVPVRELLRSLLAELAAEKTAARGILELILSLEWIAAGLFLLQLPASYFMVRLDYRMRWYVLTDRSLRIREGVVRVREATMSFANIQNVTVRQGPIERLLGIADVEVRTAGGGGREEGRHDKEPFRRRDPVHLAYFRGVAEAEKIRDLILGELRRTGGAGLGDPEDSRAGGAGLLEEAARAARELRDEARALASALAGR